jgi:hypothetical protein
MWKRASEEQPAPEQTIDVTDTKGTLIYGTTLNAPLMLDGVPLDWTKDWLWRPAKQHKSTCATNSGPEAPGLCDCDESAKLTVQVTPESALEIGIVKSDEKMSAYHVWNRVGTSWQANVFIDLVKMHCTAAIPLMDEQNQNGSQKAKLMSVPEVLGRSCALMDGILLELDARGWTAKLPGMDELREGKPEAAGFRPEGKKS